MSAEFTLLEHMAACESAFQLMMEENRLLKSTGAPPGNDFLARKRVVLAQLDTALAMLRSLGDPLPELAPRQKAAIVKTQQIVMKALLLDRENEQLLMKCTAASRCPTLPQPRPTLDQIQRLYRKNAAV